MDNLFSFVKNIPVQVITYANGKINIGLQVTEKRPDGFHNISSLFYPVGLCDILEAVVNCDGKFRLETWGTEIPGTTDDNLVSKAFQLLGRDYPLPGFDFFLAKKIPPGSGLGGGSSDGARALWLMDKLAGLSLDEASMIKYASVLGSDCAFFAGKGPRFVSGRGEVTEPAGIDLSGLYICIIHPGFGVSTKEAYSMIVPDDTRAPLHELLQNPVSRWKDLIYNDFEIPVMSKYPVIREIKKQLYVSGALYAAMSGSGSGVYGLFSKEPGVKQLFSNYFYWEGKI